MKSLFVILAGLIASWYYMDISSGSSLEGALYPAVFFICLVSLAVWIVFKLHSSGIKQTIPSTSGVDAISSNGDSGDCY